ncbi:SMP-30/gluconolactonase/LRE family protein [Nocardia sp. NPDC003963]
MNAQRMEPVRWAAPTAPPRARQKSSNPPLPPVRRIELAGYGPEDVVFAGPGTVYTGTAEGDIVRVDLDSGHTRTVVTTGGRPLGLHADPDGSLLICDAHRGLLRWDGTSPTVEVLVDTVDGRALNFASNVVRDPRDGTIYFTESSRRWSLEQWRGDLFEHSGTGSLFALTADGRVTTLLTDLQFANGVTMAPDGRSLIIAETAAYRLNRYRLRGPRAGTREVLADNLPGFPDNLGPGTDGLIWVGMVSPRNRMLDALLARPGRLRSLLWRVPERIQPAPEHTVWVLGVDADGTIVHDLQRPAGDYSMVTAVAEQGGTLVLGSLQESAVAVTRVNA